MKPEILAVAVLAAGLTWLGAALARRYALARRMLDHPGERRSHGGAVPRGGGIGVPVALALVTALAHERGLVAGAPAIGFCGGLALVALAGWLEDRLDLPIVTRLAAQGLAVAWLLAWTGGLTAVDLGVVEVPLGAAGHLLAFLGCLWLVNLYNFMDGIDALAVSEGTFAGAVLGTWFGLAGEAGLALLSWAVAFACSGFLPWNLPPARLFLGDVGSTSLGFVFAALALRGEQTGTLPVAVSVMVLGVFIFDATFTVLARMMKGSRWYTPHREHAYQYMVRTGLGHGRVVLRLTAVNLLVILPVVVVSWHWPALAGPALAGCMTVALALWVTTRRRCAADVNFS